MTYPGGKNGAGVYQTIINLMPPHDVYIEPFLGGGAIMRLKLPARVNIGVDLDPRAPGLAIAPGLKTAISAGIAKCGAGGLHPQKWRSAIADPRSTRGKNGEAGSRFKFLHGDGIQFLEVYPFSGNELVYCDPPYIRSTRSGRDLYRHEMTDVDHRHLLRVLRGLPCMVMISGYWSEMYAEALEGWAHATFQAMTRGGRPATEWLWFNFSRPVELHDYSYLGTTFRDRERIKRKKQRWAARLRRMPELERQALLAAIASTAEKDDEARTSFATR